VSEPRSLAGFEDAVRALLAWSEAFHVPVLIIGGIAVSMLSKPRTTNDLDAVAWLPDQEAWAAFLVGGERYGIVPRISDALDFAQRSGSCSFDTTHPGSPSTSRSAPSRSRRTPFAERFAPMWVVSACRSQPPKISSS
jgi:hypothetical protein